MIRRRRPSPFISNGHALQRLFERGLKAVQVQSIVESGEVIASYPGAQPLPSFLILGWVKERPLHVVLAVDAENQRCQVVTASIPDPALWNRDFKTRRMP
jgi:hypothetical protein